MTDPLDMSLDELSKRSSVGNGSGKSRKSGGRRDRTRNSRDMKPYSRNGGGGGGRGRGSLRSGGDNTVFVGNLSWKAEWQDLKDLMGEAGEVEYAEIIMNREGKPSGGGLVRFASAKAAKRAIQDMQDTELLGRPIFVREDREA